LKKIFIFLTILISISIHAFPKESFGDIREDKVQAAFIYKFIQFIEWPPEIKKASNKFEIVIYGKSNMKELLQTFSGEKVNGRFLEIHSVEDLDNIKKSHILFISPSEISKLDEILETLKGSSVLTISRMEGFAQKGGMINFYVNEERVRFEINPDSVKNAGLKISSKLLKVSKVIRTPNS
jgi:hypothetical protein